MEIDYTHLCFRNQLQKMNTLILDSTMRIVSLQTSLSFQELNQLNREFPQFLFLSSQRKNISLKEQWSKIEVLFGNRLSAEELMWAEQLKWIHSPSAQIRHLCLKEIEQQGDILVTEPRDENIGQIGEYLLAAVLAFSKNLFHWKEALHFPHLVWDSKWRNSMWTLKEKIFLQIGMSSAGIEIAKRMAEAEMTVIGVNEKGSFFPSCHKYYSYASLPKLLPEADVVNIMLPQEKPYEKWFTEKEMQLTKEGSILSILGSPKCLEEEALIALSKKWRGVILDASFQFPISVHSKLWSLPNILITPEVAPRPKTTAKEAYKTFRYNLRQYYHGNFSEMKNLIDPSILYTQAEET